MTRLDFTERFVRGFLAAVSAFAAWQLFDHPALRLIAALFAAYALYEAVAAHCPIHARLCDASGSLPRTARYLLAFVALQLSLAFEWAGAGASKLANPEFASGLAQTFGTFAAKNPYPWYADYLTGTATAYATTLANAIQWSQVAIAVVLAAAAVKLLYVKDPVLRRMAAAASIVALVGGMIMNANFYLAAGWMSPSTHGLNLVMFWAQAALAYAWLGEMESRRA